MPNAIRGLFFALAVVAVPGCGFGGHLAESLDRYGQHNWGWEKPLPPGPQIKRMTLGRECTDEDWELTRVSIRQKSAYAFYDGDLRYIEIPEGEQHIRCMMDVGRDGRLAYEIHFVRVAEPPKSVFRVVQLGGELEDGEENPDPAIVGEEPEYRYKFGERRVRQDRCGEISGNEFEPLWADGFENHVPTLTTVCGIGPQCLRLAVERGDHRGTEKLPYSVTSPQPNLAVRYCRSMLKAVGEEHFERQGSFRFFGPGGVQIE